MKKIVLLMLALGLFLTSANAASNSKKSSWVPYSDYVKSKKK